MNVLLLIQLISAISDALRHMQITIARASFPGTIHMLHPATFAPVTRKKAVGVFNMIFFA